MQSQKLESLLQSSDYISQILDFMKDKLNQSKQQKNDFNDDGIEYLQKAIDLKMSFRILADGIETNRALVQVQKQQIQKKKVFLEGLQNYKATLKNQIGQSRIDVVDAKDYIEEESSEPIDWIANFKDQQAKALNTLQQFNQRKNLYEKQQQKKQQLIKKIHSSQEKFKKTFPQQAKKLNGVIGQTCKIFNIKQIDNLSISEFKSKKIQRIHSLLFPLKIKGLIDIKYLNQFDTQELEITVQKGFFPLYQYAKQNKIMIQEKQFKFYIANITKEGEFQRQQVMAVTVSRRQEFSTQQIFNNLLLQEKIKQIYSNPKSEAQRNTNNKYSQLNWIEEILASSSSIINGNQFIEIVKNRVFHIYLIRHAFENISKKISYYFPLFKQREEGNKLSNFPMLQSKKIIIPKCQKTTFDEYKKQIYIPDWVNKVLNNYEIIKQKARSFNRQNSFNSVDYPDQSLLNKYLEQNSLQELYIKDFYSYYKFELLVQKSIYSGFFLIPNDYPNLRSVVRLINFKKGNDSTQNSKISHLILKQQSSQYTEVKNQIFNNELNDLQTELNKQIETFISRGDNNKNEVPNEIIKKKSSFLIYFQINRLISIMIEKIIKNQNQS